MPPEQSNYFIKICCLAFVGLSALHFQCAGPSQEAQETAYRFHRIPQQSHTQASLRGLSVVDTSVVWASGSQGTYLRTVDGGITWQAGQVPGADSADFRDVAAFSAHTAYLMSAGLPALIYKTTDGGHTWQLQYKNTRTGIFFDAFAFWDENRGIAMSDPVDGHFVLIQTEDGGENWEQIPAANTPEAAQGEAGFAGSGTGLVVQDRQLVWFATGGQTSRVFRSADGGASWQAAEAPVLQGTASTGVFSMSFADSLHGVAVGGDYLQPGAHTKNGCFTADGGLSWQLSETPPAGYRSGVAYMPSLSLYVCTGTNGSDYSADGGKNWQVADTIGYHAIQFAGNATIGWATGAEGLVTKINIAKENR